MTAGRRGEKIGWTGSWLGGFIWLVFFSLVFFYQGKWLQGFLGLILVAAAVFSIFFFAPWRFPNTPYGKLMLAPYGIFFLSIACVLWAVGGLTAAGLNAWNILWFFPMLIPFASLRNRKWIDGQA